MSFERLHSDDTGLYVPSPAEASVDRWEDETAHLARRALVTGGLAAVMVAAVPFLRFVFSYLSVLIHELGHSAAAWALGSPAVPALDFLHGGGISLYRDPSFVLLAMLAMLWFWLITSVWAWPRARGLVFALLGVWAVCAVTPVRTVVITAMGHGTELIVAGLFLSRATSGRGIDRWERPVYAFAGWFVLVVNASLGWRLLTDGGERVRYEMAKGEAISMDLGQLAASMHIPAG